MSSAATLTAPSGSTQASLARGWSAITLWRAARGDLGVQVEAEIADIGAAPGVDHHVVAVEGGDVGEVGVDGVARRRAAQHLALVIETTSSEPSGIQPSPEG